jgi:hypothetical protein
MLHLGEKKNQFVMFGKKKNQYQKFGSKFQMPTLGKYTTSKEEDNDKKKHSIEKK